MFEDDELSTEDLTIDEILDVLYEYLEEADPEVEELDFNE